MVFLVALNGLTLINGNTSNPKFYYIIPKWMGSTHLCTYVNLFTFHILHNPYSCTFKQDSLNFSLINIDK